MLKPRTIAIIAVGTALMGVVAWLWWSAPGEWRIDHQNASLAARGKPLYDQHCAACHGYQLEGQPNWKSRDARGRLPAPPHDAAGHTWHHDDRTLFEITKFGTAKFGPAGYESDMPAFDGVLGDDEIVAVLAYIKSRWPEEIHAKRREAKMS